MLSNLIDELTLFLQKAQTYLYPWLIFFACLWIFNIINWVTGSKFNHFGIMPRTAKGLIGILFSPFLHQNFNHLFFNSIPLFALGLAILSKNLALFLEATFLIIILGGLLVWLFGRNAIHIGASGLVSGYFGLILAHAYSNPSFTTLLLALIVIYYFGGIFLGIFPKEEKISWESHLFGFIAGIATAFILPFLGSLAFFQNIIKNIN